MAPLSRREFGKAIGAGTALAWVATPTASAANAIIGATTASFLDLPRETGKDNLTDILRALKQAKVSHTELASSNIEPAPPPTSAFMGGSAAYPRRVVLSPEEVAATNTWARSALRSWRLTTPTTHFASVRNTVAAAGVRLHAVALPLNDSFTDAELDAAFAQVKALGVNTIGSPLTMNLARRVAPFAERHQIAIAIHHQDAGVSAGAITVDGLAAALALSPAFAVKLDIGTLTSAGCDVAAELRALLPRVSYVVVRDRLARGGAGQPLGEGDAPVPDVLRILSASPRVIPAFFEYDYPGLRSSVEEVAASVAYLERAAR